MKQVQNKFNKLNILRNIQRKFWDVDVDLPLRILQTLIALKSKMISNMHIIQTRVMYYLNHILVLLFSYLNSASDAMNKTKP